jgi:uncharacterized membrane protein
MLIVIQMILYSVFLPICISVLWGVSNFFYKLSTETLSSVALFLVSSIVMLMVAVVWAMFDREALKRCVRVPSRATMWGVLWAAVGGLLAAFGSLVYAYALGKSTEPHVVTAIAYSAPAVSFVMMYAFLERSESTRKNVLAHASATALIVSGVAIFAVKS